MRANELPTFEEMRSNGHGMLGDVQDELRSDWRPGTGPNAKQARLMRSAKDLIAQARKVLDQVAAAADEDDEDEDATNDFPWMAGADYFPPLYDEDDEDDEDEVPEDEVPENERHQPCTPPGYKYHPWLGGDDYPPYPRPDE